VSAPGMKPQQLSTPHIMFCHLCVKVMADIVRPYIENGGIPDDLEVPAAMPAYSMAIFVVNGVAVSLPVCFRHFVEATKTASSLIT
jgi:hypothetical protein